jgi:hypothetical protein
MRRVFVLSLTLFVSAFGSSSTAQTTHPLIAEATENYGFVKANLLRLAEKMPEDQYGFKPVQEIRSFRESIAHAADSQAFTCALVNGEKSTVEAASRKTKSDLVTALKAAYAICDASMAGLTDASMAGMVRLGQSARYRSKIGLLVGMISHANEQYGYAAVYLRLKGIVPPSSEGQQ